MTVPFRILFSLLLSLSLIGCMLQRSGLAPAETIDPDFHGCFERTDAPSGQIVITPPINNLIRGNGEGLINGPDTGWTFTGSITSERVAILHITMEGESFDVYASRPSPDPPYDLTLQRSGHPVLTLARCD